ncbi:hypothetical protein OH76DRAFT_1298102, partial [Lentinus brumalis]
FIATTDLKFGPISRLQGKNGEKPRIIKWTAFQLDDTDWEKVQLCADILADANRYHQVCSSTRMPTLWQVIPAIEALSSRCEKKADNPKYALFHDALRKGLKKLLKYYKLLDNANAYILALFLHPYFKLRYIEEQWGGEDEYQAELDAGIPNAWNWQQYARDVVEKTMKKYWDDSLKTANQGATVNQAPVVATSKSKAHASAGSDSEDDYDRARLQRLQAGKADAEGWKVELQ